MTGPADAQTEQEMTQKISNELEKGRELKMQNTTRNISNELEMCKYCQSMRRHGGYQMNLEPRNDTAKHDTEYIK